MFGVIELADDLNIVFSRKDFKDKHFILLPIKKRDENPTRICANFNEFLGVLRIFFCLNGAFQI